MAKPKAAPVKAGKGVLRGKVLKKKALKHATSTPKLKKLTAAQIRESTKPPSSTKTSLVLPEPASESDADSEPAGRFVLAPKSPIDMDQVREGVRALFEYFGKKESRRTELFDDAQPIFLRITSIKVPQTPNRQIRLTLKHKLISDSDDVCLIVKDIGRAKDHEDTIEFFEKLLLEKGIDNIKTIMPYHQFKTEYANTFELKRRLLNLYDYFLVDSRINGYVAHLAGKVFLSKRKMPTSVKMNVPNLKKHIDQCLRKSLMKLHSKSDCYVVQVGHSKLQPEEVFENVKEVVHQLSDVFPGGVDNIRALALKTTVNLDIPVYLTLKNKTTVNVPIQTAKRPKHCREVTGELTTYLDRDVTVLPSGKVIVLDKRTKDEQLSEASFDDEFELDTTEDTKILPLSLQAETGEEHRSTTKVEGGECESKPAQNGLKKSKFKKPQKEEKLEDESNSVLANAEEAYLNMYIEEQKESENLDKQNENNGKKSSKIMNNKPIKKSSKRNLEQKQEPDLLKNANTRKTKAKPNTEEIPAKKSKMVVEGKKKTQNKKIDDPLKTKDDKFVATTSIGKSNGRIMQSKTDKRAIFKLKTKEKKYRQATAM